MKKTKLYFSFVLNILLFIFTFISIGNYFWSTGDANMTVHGVSCFRYYTNLSNILMAIASLITLFYLSKSLFKNKEYNLPKWLLVLRNVSTTSVTVTFLTVVFFLGPLAVSNGNSYFIMFKGMAFFLHFLNPVIAIILSIFFDNTSILNKKYSLLGMTTTFLYGIIYLPMILTNKWPDFYGFTFGGKYYLTPIVLVVILTFTGLFSFTLLIQGNKFSNK